MAVTHKLKNRRGVVVFGNARDPPPHIPIVSIEQYQIALVRRFVYKYDELNYNMQLSTIDSN